MHGRLRRLQQQAVKQRHAAGVEQLLKFDQHFTDRMSKHFGRRISFSQSVGIAGGDHVGLGDGERRSIDHRVGRGLVERNATLTLSAG